MGRIILYGPNGKFYIRNQRLPGCDDVASEDRSKNQMHAIQFHLSRKVEEKRRRPGHLEVMNFSCHRVPHCEVKNIWCDLNDHRRTRRQQQLENFGARSSVIVEEKQLKQLK